MMLQPKDGVHMILLDRRYYILLHLPFRKRIVCTDQLYRGKNRDNAFDHDMADIGNRITRT